MAKQEAKQGERMAQNEYDQACRFVLMAKFVPLLLWLTHLGVAQWNFCDEDAAFWVAEVEQGNAPILLLVWLPLFNGGNVRSLRERWLALFNKEQDPQVRKALTLVLLFAETVARARQPRRVATGNRCGRRKG